MTRLAGCIVRNEADEVLVLYRGAPRDRWETPGGKLESDESPVDAVVREFREELGVMIRVEHSLGTTRFTEQATTFTYDWFTAVIVDGVPTILEPEKHERMAYVPWTVLATLPISANFQAFLQQYPTLASLDESRT